MEERGRFNLFHLFQQYNLTFEIPPHLIIIGISPILHSLFNIHSWRIAD